MTEAFKDQAETDQPQSQDGGKKDRDRSSVQFPYLSLDEAITIAKGVQAVGGASCQIDQLAAHLKQKPDTGSFRLKLGVTKMFGLITYSTGTVTLTALGNQVCDPQQEAAARVQAFFNIPLYQKVYEVFKGGNLPPIAGLESAMVTMGVAPKQKTTARQVFHRSATLAGFFWSGIDRLVQPPIKAGTGSGIQSPGGSSTPPEKPLEKPANGSGDDGNGGGEQHPFIQGLIKTLPKANSPWPIDKRAQWLQAAVSVFNLIYADDASTGRIEVKVQKESAQ